MPRRPRVFVEGGIYHVYNRFARGAEILMGATYTFAHLLTDGCHVSLYDFSSGERRNLKRHNVIRGTLQGLRKERDDPGFASRLNDLDSAISRR